MAKRLPAVDAPLPGIEHIVVLMLENRSFDNILGTLPSSPEFWGLPLTKTNTYTDKDGLSCTVPVTNQPPSGQSVFVAPNPDPGEPYDDMTAQIFGYQQDGTPIDPCKDTDAKATMAGFAQNYYDVAEGKGGVAGDIMTYFTPDQVPVSSYLAGQYAVCDQWSASGPVQTFPNRLFAHCGTPGAWHLPLDRNLHAFLNDIDYLPFLPLADRTVFELLDQGAAKPDPANWKVYFHDVSLSAVLTKYVADAFLDASPCVASFDGSDFDPPFGTTFAQDVLDDTLPAYAFIEPRYYDNVSGSGGPSNSNHPGNSGILGEAPARSVADGEQLVLDVFAALVANPAVMAKTLLIVTYDEHGGVYDHVPPPSGAAEGVVSPFPGDAMPVNFDYCRLGVRVPTFFFNPCIPPNTLFRPAADNTHFDHTSLIATVRDQFGLGATLTPRDAAAPTLVGLIPAGATPQDEDYTQRLRTLQAAVTTLAPGKPGKPVSRPDPVKWLAEIIEWLLKARRQAAGL
ncbi:alkaline phosphatase family protein [Nitrospirillum sp. BR 11163]|uniref:alkaline phosphatase family protein n=1 Tax=Nitrospirillum sp. BR 11163 TaxID=3104323 RepID=UPI002AFEAABD|nr:alkaline phosphatase family protein [Nitrospirillum sp. BR 11163]MEA1676097.1 alkaline phosphatase family protein [Nitrospirillum sp. BR 11163]